MCDCIRYAQESIGDKLGSMIDNMFKLSFFKEKELAGKNTMLGNQAREGTQGVIGFSTPPSTPQRQVRLH